MITSTATSILRFTIRLQGGIALAIGGLVVIAWKLDLAGLIYLLPRWPAMPFNSALWLVLTGIGLITTTIRPIQWMAKVCGLLVAGMALMVVWQYVLGVSLGIDDLFQRTDLVKWPRYPGRPSENAAVAFALAGLALMLHSRPLTVTRAVPIGLCGAAVTAAASVSLFARTLALSEGVPWLVGGQAMAVHTSVGLILIGSGLALLTWFVSDRIAPPQWIPVAIGGLESIRVAGHNMKGLGGAYGFPRISEIGHTLEDAACAHDAAAIRAAIDTLNAYLSDVKVTYA